MSSAVSVPVPGSDTFDYQCATISQFLFKQANKFKLNRAYHTLNWRSKISKIFSSSDDKKNQ